MRFIADLHIHSKYSRATAKDLDLEHLYYAAQIKGISVVGTGDFTYPAWAEEIEAKLVEAEPGLFCLKKQIADQIDPSIPRNLRAPVRFMLQTEISNIYKKGGKVRKNHNLVFFPDINSVKRFNAKLETLGNIKSDGRPILGLDARDLLSIVLETDARGFLVPAHIWTPWFSLFGSKSGFDSMEECFSDLTPHIFAVETGLSSDPPMNWRIGDLDHVRLISNSDAHSPGYLGRNANVFDTEPDYFHIRRALEENDPNAFQGTLDMYPHQGKYHYDGHRKCEVCLNPEKTQVLGGICPECGRTLTLGVLNRVQELAIRPEGYRPENRHPYKNIIPLADILSEIFDLGPKSKKVLEAYKRATESLGPELHILTGLSVQEIDTAKIPLLGEAVRRMREGQVRIDPGFDGEFGKVGIFSAQEKQALRGERHFLFPAAGDRIQEKEVQFPLRKKKQGIKKKPDSFEKPLERPKHQGDLLEGLNPDQQRAVESEARGIIIQAGPGTGKTRTLTARIAFLVSVRAIDPGAILALTFTNKAAKELEKRIQSHLPGAGTTVLAATFHGFCLKLLREYRGFDASIADDDQRTSLIREALGQKTPKKDVSSIDLAISRLKQNLLMPDDDFTTAFDGPEGSDRLRGAYRSYLSLCKENNIADFEDLVFQTVVMLKEDKDILSAVRRRFRYIFIDEYQDLNYGQYELVRLLSEENHIVAIGDPDQSIYGFRGSDNIYFKRFENDFKGCEKIILTRNYRSAQTILDASFQVICRSEGERDNIRIFSEIGTQKKLLIKETASEQAEAFGIVKMIETLMGGTSFFSMDSRNSEFDDALSYSFSDFAVLTRTQRQYDDFIPVFEKSGIPFQTADKNGLRALDGISQLTSLLKTITRHKENAGMPPLPSGFDAKSIQALTSGTGFADNASIIQWVSQTARLEKVIKKTAKAAEAYERMLLQSNRFENIKDFLYAQALDQDSDALDYGVEKVSLLTLHAAKGLEFPVVFVAGCEQGLIPFARDGLSIENLEEERRLFYVAMTRAMDILCLTYAQKRRIYGRPEKRQRSLFIDDIEKKLTRMEKIPVRMPEEKKPQQLELF